MRMLILPTVLASTVGLGFLPSHAEASWLSKALHKVRGDDCAPVYVPPAYCPPVYAPSYGYSEYTPDYCPPPVYRSYSYPSYREYKYYPRYRSEWGGYRGYYGGYRGYDRHHHRGHHRYHGHHHR
jgi:hypothetical protein